MPDDFFEGLDPGVPFIVRLYDDPWGIRGVGPGQHLIDRCIVEIPFLPVPPVLFGYLILLEGIIFPLVEAFELFLLAYLKPEFDDSPATALNIVLFPVSYTHLTL